MERNQRLVEDKVEDMEFVRGRVVVWLPCGIYLVKPFLELTNGRV